MNALLEIVKYYFQYYFQDDSALTIEPEDGKIEGTVMYIFSFPQKYYIYQILGDDHT